MIKIFHRHINHAGMALLLLLLFSCSDNSLPESPDRVNTEQAPLQVTSASTGTGIAVQTRTEPRMVLTSGNIGMFRKADITNGYTAITNLRFTYSTPYWQPDEQILLGTQSALLAAYYPYADGKVNPIMLHSQRYDPGEELYYQHLEANKTTSVVTLDLARAYSRIVFNFKADPEYIGEGKVTAIRLEGDGIIPAATLDLLNPGDIRNVLTPVTGINVAEITGFKTQFNGTNADIADCLMIPHLLRDNITLTITVDGEKKTGTVTAKQLCGANGILTEGTKYEINITVRQFENLVINSIQTTDWDSVPEWNQDVTFPTP